MRLRWSTIAPTGWQSVPITWESESVFGDDALGLYANSVIGNDETRYCLVRRDGRKYLGIFGAGAEGFEGEYHQEPDDLFLCPLSAANAALLRERLPWLRPQTLGLSTSVGCGDRLGLATPGHVGAVRSVRGVRPILAQQSMRENARTGRAPQEVIDDATWGLFQEGWRDPWGADADHLKSTDHIDLCAAAGYTFYTVDPGDHVDNDAHTASPAVLQDKLRVLPWERLEDTPSDLRARYLGHPIKLASTSLEFGEETLLRAACKYGAALAFTAEMYRHLSAAMGSRPFELEVSVDETETPTSPLEHVFVARELARLGVRWISLAPRYVGRFEKGVDYIGDPAAFEAEFAQHAEIAQAFGPYKLSLHSGSDKFSIYPIVARLTNGLVHLKTAGTSYLEALRAVAQVDPSLFRDILALAHECYETDKISYHVSANPSKVPMPDTLGDDALASVLDLFDGRQMLHVTFGSVLDHFGDRLKAVLEAREEAHYAAVKAHFARHLASFDGLSD
ncbi:MAG: hypothetical protein JXB07_21205 [Anaerolineae bacterium]|nr:hypothetical protein [Anaerolineae bacterium]